MDAIRNLPWWAPWVGSFVAGALVLAVLLRSARGVARSPRTVSLLLAVQALVIIALAVVPFGFDHPSSVGLDFGHFLAAVGLYLLFLAGGVSVAWKQKRWIALTAQIAVPCAIAGLVAFGFVNV